MTSDAWENYRCPNCGGYPQHLAGCMTPGAPFFAPIQAQYGASSGTSANTNYTMPPPPMATVAPLPPESEREWLDREIQKVRELARV